jgi:hypothetical protein
MPKGKQKRKTQNKGLLCLRIEFFPGCEKIGAILCAIMQRKPLQDNATQDVSNRYCHHQETIEPLNR